MVDRKLTQLLRLGQSSVSELSLKKWIKLLLGRRHLKEKEMQHVHRSKGEMNWSLFLKSQAFLLVQASWEGSYGEVGPAIESHFGFFNAKGTCLRHIVHYV